MFIPLDVTYDIRYSFSSYLTNIKRVGVKIATKLEWVTIATKPGGDENCYRTSSVAIITPPPTPGSVAIIPPPVWKTNAEIVSSVESSLAFRFGRRYMVEPPIPIPFRTDYESFMYSKKRYLSRLRTIIVSPFSISLPSRFFFFFFF